MMLAWTTQPGRPLSCDVRNVPEADPADGSVLVETLSIGVCGTDREIITGKYGRAPEGCDYLILGHESLGRVLSAPSSSGLFPGDLVAGVVRRPDPLPCANCAVGEWDMCLNGQYTERGIYRRHGYASERFRIEPEFAVKLAPSLGRIGVLLEPASIVAKAWEQIDRTGLRTHYIPRRVLVAGAGAIGLLAALFGVQRGFEVHVLDRVAVGIKPQLAKKLGAIYHCSTSRKAWPEVDVVIECTGAGQLVVDALKTSGPCGIVCLTGIPSGKREICLRMGGLVLENQVIFGSVNANLRHYRLAADTLALSDTDWLERLITRRLPPDLWRDAFERDPVRNIKSVIQFKP
jgi:threonine dehydrogenase-like Zn-dependent dehydrogenase